MEEERSNVIRFPLHRRRAIPVAWAGGGRLLTERTEREATILLAELRGWRTIMDAVGPPLTASALSKVVDRTLETLSGFDAGDLTIEGDPMQPVVSATFGGARHALRGVRAAAAVRDAVDDAQSAVPPHHRFQVCAGIDTGRILDMALGDAGDPVRSLGRLRSFASRLQEFAGPGQIILSGTTYGLLGEIASVRPLGEVRAGGCGLKHEAFALEALAETPSVGRPLR